MGAGKNIGFISFRISGTDGVSLETKKWAKVYEELGHHCFYMAGELDTPESCSYSFPEAHFSTPEVKSLYLECFDKKTRSPSTSLMLREEAEKLKRGLYEFVHKFKIDVIIPQNTLTIPLNVPLGMATTEFIAETGMPTIAHHHDFFWERKRFSNNCIGDILDMCYPPSLKGIEHVVINTTAQNQLAWRKGDPSTLIPNVMDFENEPDPPDDYTKSVREDLGIENDELFVLQPTRVVQRKGIEHAIEFIHRLEKKSVLVISHASGDEGYEYQTRVKEFAELLNVRTIFVDELVTETRSVTADGRKTYTLQDLYPYADLVAYPSIHEGFGNAFLEAIYFKKMILVNEYPVYTCDIKPKGFKVIEMDEYISSQTMDFTHQILNDPKLEKEMVEHNYEVAKCFYSYALLRDQLEIFLERFWGHPAS